MPLDCRPARQQLLRPQAKGASGRRPEELPAPEDAKAWERFYTVCASRSKVLCVELGQRLASAFQLVDPMPVNEALTPTTIDRLGRCSQRLAQKLSSCLRYRQAVRLSEARDAPINVSVGADMQSRRHGISVSIIIELFGQRQRARRQRDNATASSAHQDQTICIQLETPSDTNIAAAPAATTTAPAPPSMV